ncbi:uncharacterized protein DS421_12g378090 [Arachis hypogaea]|nr:uncharacterized protein DS421_12g378090 [Arachis hypogaea]
MKRRSFVAFLQKSSFSFSSSTGSHSSHSYPRPQNTTLFPRLLPTVAKFSFIAAVSCVQALLLSRSSTTVSGAQA